MEEKADLSILKMERDPSPVQQQQQQQQQTQIPLPVQQPKGRGRPRASYAQTGEFDLGLIREYRARPALYDRSNKRFKDKMHMAQLWLQISHKLGYDVCILRERMITLRNRYNIEKRRVENNTLTAGSQWPLYENLSFLSEHIRTRRSYKTQSKSLDGTHQDDEDDEEVFDVDDINDVCNGLAKGIKHEVETDYDDMDEYDCDRQMPVTTVLSIPMNGSNNFMNGVLGRQQTAHSRQPELGLSVAKPKRAQQVLEDEPPVKRPVTSTAAGATAAASACTEGKTSAVATTALTTYPKFRAFGEFVSHSLNELPHAMSMRLVEKFTRELVQASIANEQINLKQNQNQDSLDPSSMDEMDE